MNPEFLALKGLLKALGLGNKDVVSLEVNLKIELDKPITVQVTYVEYRDARQALTDYLEPTNEIHLR